MIGLLRVMELTRCVANKVHRPAEKLLKEEIVAYHNRRVLESLTKLVLTLLRDIDAKDLSLFLNFRVAELLPSPGNKDLITS